MSNNVKRLISEARALQLCEPGHATDIERVQALCDHLVKMANAMESYLETRDIGISQMTVASMIDTLKGYPPEATVFLYSRADDAVYPIIAVTPSEDAPNSEVYIDFGEAES